jgi:Uma2 family endonuclease
MVAISEPRVINLDEFMTHPVDDYEWVDGQLAEKHGMTLRHGQVQLRLGSYWRSYKISSNQGGEVYTEALCRTSRQGRRPDVAYLTAELLEQFANLTSLPQSFPLIAEIASPDDSAEELFAKAREYLESGCLEVWLVFPEGRWIAIITQTQHVLLTMGQIAETIAVLQGFSVPVDELFA